MQLYFVKPDLTYFDNCKNSVIGIIPGVIP